MWNIFNLDIRVCPRRLDPFYVGYMISIQLTIYITKLLFILSLECTYKMQCVPIKPMYDILLACLTFETFCWLKLKKKQVKSFFKSWLDCNCPRLLDPFYIVTIKMGQDFFGIQYLLTVHMLAMSSINKNLGT